MSSATDNWDSTGHAHRNRDRSALPSIATRPNSDQRSASADGVASSTNSRRPNKPSRPRFSSPSMTLASVAGAGTQASAKSSQRDDMTDEPTPAPDAPAQEQITLSKAVENTVAFVQGLGKKYSMKHETVLAILQLELQLFHMAEQKQMMGSMSNGQALVDAVAAEQEAKRREA